MTFQVIAALTSSIAGLRIEEETTMTGFWKSWMTVWCWATLAFGAVFAIAALPGAAGGPLEQPALLFYDLVYWPLDAAPGFDPVTRFTCGVLGAVMIGWAITIFALLPVANAQAWRTFTLGMVIWYAVDSFISVSNGAPVNAVSNTVFLATFLAPVLGSGVMKST